MRVLVIATPLGHLVQEAPSCLTHFLQLLWQFAHGPYCFPGFLKCWKPGAHRKQDCGNTVDIPTAALGPAHMNLLFCAGVLQA